MDIRALLDDVQALIKKSLASGTGLKPIEEADKAIDAFLNDALNRN